MDPTAAVAPERVTRSLNLEPTQGLVGGALRTMSPELQAQLRAGWEALNNRWNQWVLNYSRTQQFDLLQSLGIRAPDWQADVGWLRADPTAAVAPDRIERSRPLAPRPGLVAGTLHAVNPELLTKVLRAWEALNNRWNQSVLNYSRSDQFDLLRRLGVRSPSWQDLALVLAITLAGAGAAGAAWGMWDRHRQDPWQRLQARVREKLLALGVESAPHEAPRTLAARVRRELGGAGTGVADLLDALDRLRYGRNEIRRPDPGWLRAFARAASALPATRSKHSAPNLAQPGQGVESKRW
jgi:hypothetical protein